MPNVRPLTLTRPASTTRGILPAVEGPATPTGLQRQATSLYSNFSTGSGPLLVYGKIATPLAGDWSAEPWSPNGLEAAAEEQHDEAGYMLASVPLEADGRMDTEDTEPTFDDFSSAAETAAYIADNHTEDSLPRVPTTTPAVMESEQQQPEQQPEQEGPVDHVTLVYRNDPYTLFGRRELHRCFCDTCMSSAVVDVNEQPAMTGEMYGMNPYGPQDTAAYMEPQPEYVPAQNEAYDMTHHHLHHQEQQEMPAQWASASAAAQPAPQQPTATTFMPPPPPPRITRRVLGESAEPSLDVDAAFYYVAMRWYSKLEAVQTNFVEKDELCPAPGSPDQTFLEWVDEVGRWWLRHFEHRQTKVSSSSLLLRSSYTVAQARASGFATHVPPAAKREVPRRQVGTSGLNADMLAQLDGRPAGRVALPTPRSLEKRRCEELPW